MNVYVLEVCMNLSVIKAMLTEEAYCKVPGSSTKHETYREMEVNLKLNLILYRYRKVNCSETTKTRE